MKQILFSLIAAASLTTVVAQNDFTPEKGDITIAPQLGINFSTYSSEDDLDYGSRTSLNIGVIGNYFFNNRWSFRSGLLFDTRGTEDRLDNTDKLNYLAIPLNANWHFGSNRNWHLNFGVTPSILLSADGELADGTEVDLSPVINGFDIGLSFGIGYQIDVSEKFRLGFDFQGYGGFLDLLKDEVGAGVTLRSSRSALSVQGIFKL